MIKLLSDINKRALFDLAPILVSIYCAAILGDYITEALVISRLGVDTIPSLFPVNAFLLFVVTTALFGYVDKIDRWQLIIYISVASFVMAIIGGLFFLGGFRFATVMLYSLAYLSKLSSFVVFWIIANDICDTRKSKAVFPILAGSGLLGGLITTVMAGKLIQIITVEHIYWLWVIALLLPLAFIGKLKSRYGFRLKAMEEGRISSPFAGVLNIITDRPVIVMGLTYFTVFVLIFNIDYLFAKVLSKRYEFDGVFNAENFLETKFNIYLIVTALVVVFQFSATSNISRRFGVTGSLLILPIIFFVGFVFLFLIGRGIVFSGSNALFVFIVLFYIVRQFLFETLFSSNYQIFFSAFTRRMRGKGKLVMEGAVKPAGIGFAGFLLISFKDSSYFVFILCGLSVVLIGLVILLRKEWGLLLRREEIEIRTDDVRQLIKKEIVGQDKNRLLSLMEQAIDSNDHDLKRVAIKYLEYAGSEAAFELLRKKYYEEGDRIKEVIAASLGAFDTIEAKGFIRTLLEDKNPAIRSGALRSIRNSQGTRPPGLNLVSFLSDSSPCVFEEAVYITYKSLSIDECSLVHSKIDLFLKSDRIGEQIVALRLVGHLRIKLFEGRIAEFMLAANRDVWRTAVDSVAAFGNESSVRRLIAFIDRDVERVREYAAIEVLGKMGSAHLKLIESLFRGTKKKRTAFSLISVMRLLAAKEVVVNKEAVKLSAAVKNQLIEMANREMAMIYMDAYRYYALRLSLPMLKNEIDLLRDAIVNRRRRFASFILEMISLVEPTGALLQIDSNFRGLEERERANIVELIEAFGEKGVAKYLVPILEGVSERELLKIGATRWKYEAVSATEAILYFKTMENKWIFVVALYIEKKARLNES